jgi:hypothetical protein
MSDNASLVLIVVAVMMCIAVCSLIRHKYAGPPSPEKPKPPGDEYFVTEGHRLAVWQAYYKAMEVYYQNFPKEKNDS